MTSNATECPSTKITGIWFDGLSLLSPSWLLHSHIQAATCRKSPADADAAEAVLRKGYIKATTFLSPLSCQEQNKIDADIDWILCEATGRRDSFHVWFV